MSGELKGCPWCGKEPNIGPWGAQDLTAWPDATAIECSSDLHDCPVNPSVTGYTRAEAITAWNHRHSGGDGEAWRSIESAPEGQLVVVCWRDEEDTETPDRYEFDYLEDGVWQKHDDDYQHFCAVAPAGSRGPSEQAPYTGWRPLTAARAGERG
jgi:hypothetical protein